MSPDRSVRRGRRLTTAAPRRVSRRDRLDLPNRWTLVAHPAGGGPWNMAVDMALARTAAPHAGVLRIYRWDEPTLSFGRNQRARERYDARELAAAGIHVVRRPTGGREVVHDRELTYACIMPAQAPGLRASYRRISQALAEALRSLDVPAELSAGGHTPLSPDAGPCFGRAVADEVEVSGRKIVGSAQVRVGGFLLQHGSLLLGRPRRTPVGFEGGGISAEEALGRAVSFEDAAGALGASMEAAFGGIWERGDLDSGTLLVARELERQYASPDWTWRR